MITRNQTEIKNLLRRIAATRTPESINVMRRHSAGVMQPTNRARRRILRQEAHQEERNAGQHGED